MLEDQTTTRTCRYCNVHKSIEEFPLTRGKRFYRCKSCGVEYSRRWSARKWGKEFRQ